MDRAQDVFYRGCIDCVGEYILKMMPDFRVSDKKEACFALGGALKEVDRWTLLKCEIECCNKTNCNTQSLTLSKDAITVFTPDGNTTVVYYLPPKIGHYGWNVNGNTYLVFPNGKFPEKTGYLERYSPQFQTENVRSICVCY